jgi:hypothetical protein
MKSSIKIQSDWDEYRHNLMADTGVDANTSAADVLKHRMELERDPEKWIIFFFPKSAKYPFAPFHKRFFARVTAHPEWYEVLSWSRELSKTTCTYFILMFLALTGKKKNILLLSNSWDMAADYLEPYRANLDSNQRIITYYGDQHNVGAWEKGNFTTRSGVRFLAKGALQTPRGTKNDDVRPDAVIIDDFDTDEDVRNPDTINKKWDWFENAAYPTRSISEDLLIIWCGNIIAKDCCITRAGAKADHWDIVNIRNKNGDSVWPQKNTEQRIDRALSKISSRAAQQEYFNNPLTEGEIFKEITWGKCPPLSKMPLLVCYSDPAPSNKDRQKKGVSFKSTFLVGYSEGRFYIYTGFLDQTPNREFVAWNYAIRDYVAGKTQVYYFIENNTLQDPFFEQVYIPLFIDMAKTHGHIPISPDTRKKPDKAARIEGNLEPLNNRGMLIFNEAEHKNPHLVRLEEQFKLFSPQLKAPADGPDCVEGAVWILNEKLRNFHFQPSFGKIIHKNMY